MTDREMGGGWGVDVCVRVCACVCVCVWGGGGGVIGRAGYSSTLHLTSISQRSCNITPYIM